MNIKEYSVYIIQLLIICINHSGLTQTYDTYLLLITNTVVWHHVLGQVL